MDKRDHLRTPWAKHRSSLSLSPLLNLKMPETKAPLLANAAEVALLLYERDWYRSAVVELGLEKLPDGFEPPLLLVARELLPGDVFTYAGAFRFHALIESKPDDTYVGRFRLDVMAGSAGACCWFSLRRLGKIDTMGRTMVSGTPRGPVVRRVVRLAEERVVLVVRHKDRG